MGRNRNLARDIRDVLAKWLPKAVASAELNSPAYCLFIWYQDFSGDDVTPQFGLATSEYRDACLETMRKSSALEAIWKPQQICHDPPFPGWPVHQADCEPIAAQSRELYDRLSRRVFGPVARVVWRVRNLRADSQELEMLALNPLRDELHKMAIEMNTSIAWFDLIPVTDDFVVFPCDYIGCWAYDDFTAAVPTDKAALIDRAGLNPFD
ncbi:hypothetical protein [Planctomycetes bacterium CA13]